MKTKIYHTQLEEKLKKIADYWEDKNTISLLDSNLKNLEIQSILEYITKKHSVLDIGCGDGMSACECARFAKNVIGIDNSKNMIKKANLLKKQKKINNVEFFQQNILELSDIQKKFDIIITDRVITNLPTWDLQKQTILQIKSLMKSNSKYILIENFDDSFFLMNRLRENFGLKPILKHWHNTYLDRKKTIKFLQRNFKIITPINYNLYYLLTRIFVPMFASYTGFGKNAKSDPIFNYTDPAAKRFEEILSKKVNFLHNETIGQINGYVLIKK